MIHNGESCCHQDVVVEKIHDCCSTAKKNQEPIAKSCCSENIAQDLIDHNCNEKFNLINLNQNCGCDHQFVDLNTVLLKFNTTKLNVITDFIHLKSEVIYFKGENEQNNIDFDSPPFLLISRDICILKSSFLI